MKRGEGPYSYQQNALIPAAGDVLLSSFVFLISFGSWDKARHRNPQQPYARVVLKALGVNAGALKSFNEDAAFNLINNFHDNSVSNGPYYHCTFNPLDEIKKLNLEKEELYKSLLKEKEEKIQLLERVIQRLEQK